MRKYIPVLLCVVMIMGSVIFAGCSDREASTHEAPAEETVQKLCDTMTLEQKVAQLIMPAMRSWEGGDRNVTDLSMYPELAEALRRHQYGGVILFGQNIENTSQTVRLINDLQVNNAKSNDAQSVGCIPYLVAADEEGGAVARLSMGTRGTGSMAIGATGDNAESNALATGRIFGEELAALGINVNLAPCIDVITDLTDAGMSTRVFSDDPEVVSKLGIAFKNGVDESKVITTFKHFPGAGDGSDYPTSIWLTLEELEKNGLSTYANAISAGAEMIMTSATTFPLIDDEYLMADGVTKGYYPATLSQKFVTEMLREKYGFDGVVITDALEMEQFVTEPDNGQALFSGEYATVEHDVQVAEKAINAGCDILLIPIDLNGQKAVQYYDDYIAGIVELIKDGTISEQRIDQSVLRILELKNRHGILDIDTDGDNLDKKIETALNVVGSAEHHEAENKIAQQAITLIKNDGTLPLSANGKKTVIIGRSALDDVPVSYALDRLMADGMIDADARIENHISGKEQGDKNASTTIVVDCYYDTSSRSLAFSEELTASIHDADVVICLSAISAGIGQIQDDSPYIEGVQRAFSAAQQSGARFVLLSDNIPVDTARFHDADVIVCAYLSAGFGIDPTARTSGSENVGAFNANVPAALYAIFGGADMPGKLPISIPNMERGADGAWGYGDGILYERGLSAR